MSAYKDDEIGYKYECQKEYEEERKYRLVYEIEDDVYEDCEECI